MIRDELFPTPIWSWWYPRPADLDVWSERVLVLEQQDPQGLQITNQGGWHSSTTLLQDPILDPLFRWIATSVQDAIQMEGWDRSKASPCFNNAWAMVSRRGHGVRAHLHPNSLFSGVIYLRATESCGDIAFLDPRGGSQMLQYPQIEGAVMKNNGRVVKSVQPGLMLLFPSWLWHEVDPSETEQVRICISFNVGMRPIPSTA